MVKALVDEPLALTTAFKVAVDDVTDEAESVLAVGCCATDPVSCSCAAVSQP